MKISEIITESQYLSEESVEITPAEFHAVRTGKKTVDELAKEKNISLGRLKGEINLHADHWSKGADHYNKTFKGSDLNEISDEKRNRYVSRASDDYGMANFAARASKSHPGLEDYSKEQEARAKKRSAGLNRALSDRRTGRGDNVAESKDACYNKVKSRYKVWPSAYASGALVKCRKVGAANWGNSTKESVEEGFDAEYDDESGMAETNLHTSARAIEGLLKTIGDRDNLPEWVQEKIAKSEMMLVSAWDYLLSQKEQGRDPQISESEIQEGLEYVNEDLRKWFKEKWVRFGPDGKIRGDCARGDDSEGKPKCLPQSKAHSVGKKARASAASRKRREDPNADRSGKAINVNTKKKSNEGVAEGSADEQFDIIEEMVEQLAEDHGVDAEAIWEYFENIDDNKLFETATWQKKAGKNKNGGLNAKGVASYRRANPGSKLQTAVTTKPSKLKPGSKAAKRRKSFCARMSGMKGPMKDEKGKPTRKALSLRKWNC